MEEYRILSLASGVVFDIEPECFVLQILPSSAGGFFGIFLLRDHKLACCDPAAVVEHEGKRSKADDCPGPGFHGSGGRRAIRSSLHEDPA